MADAAYLASKTATRENCDKMDAQHVWDNGGVKERGGADMIAKFLGLHGWRGSLQGHRQTVGFRRQTRKT